MFGRTRLLKATALALPFSLTAAAAHAANVAETVRQNEQLSTFAKAMDTAKFGQQLAGEGPYTVFAPTDQAFAQLPRAALDQLMKQDNQAQLTTLLEHHVVQGDAIAADDVIGRRTEVDTMSGDTLTVDGTSQAVLLVPTGLTVARVGDQLVIEREGVAVSRRAIEVQDQVVRKAGGEQQQTQSRQPGQGQQEQQMARTPTAAESDMPMTEHQQEVLKSEPGQEQRQTAPQGATPMPATKHQRQVLAEGELPGKQQQSYEQARVEGRPDLLREATVVTAGIQADNGVIHVIDAVLLPEDVLKMLEQATQGQG